MAPMGQHVVIDGNNLWHAMKAHAPVPGVGRETLVRIIESWAGQADDAVTLVFDGPVPRGGLADQMRSSRITVQFSEHETADDVIVRLVQHAADPGVIRVISDDKAIGHEARIRRCAHATAKAFVAELYPTDREKSGSDSVDAVDEKPANPGETDEWLDEFGLKQGDDDEPFDGYNAMMGDR